MYEFIDTNEMQTTTPLPTEAVSMNGTYFENVVEGYRTLYVKGRESLGISLQTYTVGTADGERIKGSRYPARVLTIGFQLLADNETDFRNRFNQLNNLLSISEADFVFNDERDKFFTGSPIMDAEIEAGRNNVTGEWRIYCTYPFKRSINTVTLSSDDPSGVVVDNNSATFTFNYDGVMPSKPLLSAEFASAESGGSYSEDGDCGFVAFVNQNEAIVQLGNPEAVDLDPLNKNGTLVNSTFNSLTGWTASGMSVGAITDQFWNKGVGQTMNFARGNGTLTKSTEGTVNFDFSMVHRLACNGSQETGTFKCHLKNNGTVVVGFSIEKTGSGTNATVKYIINGATVGTDTIDLSYYNTNFGYCMRTPVYVQETYYEQDWTFLHEPWWRERVAPWERCKWKPYELKAVVRTVQTGWNYTQSNLNTKISRTGSTVTFSIGNLPRRTFKRSAIVATPVYDVAFESTGNLNTKGIRSCALISKKGVAFSDIPNVFTAGDIVEADCNSASVYLYRNGSIEGATAPQYGALGNDWENFNIRVGTNIIKVVWSDWVNVNYKPKITITFNKVYI